MPRELAEISVAELQFVRRGRACSKPPLVLLHGWGSDSRCWNPLLEWLEDEFECVLIDLPGFGLNELFSVDNLNALYAELEKILPEKSHLVGWSLGGMIATQLVNKFPQRFASLSTIACNAKFVESEEWQAACALEVYQKFSDGFGDDARATLQGFSLLQGRGDRQRKLLKQHFSQQGVSVNESNKYAWEAALHWLNQIDNREVLKCIDIPHFAIFGESDVLVPSALLEKFVVDKLCSQHLLVVGAGHAPHITQAELLAKELKKFITETNNPYQCDKKLVAQSFSLAAPRYEKVANMQATVAKNLVALRDDYTGDICDLGCGTGFCMDIIRPQNDNILGLDIASGMLQYCQQKYRSNPPQLICADFENLPIKPNTFDGIVSSLSVQWSENLDQLFQQVHTSLKKNAWFLFSTLGPLTLHELRNSWRQSDTFVHVNQFVSKQSILEKLSTAGFRVEVSIEEHEVLRYDTVFSLMRDLKDIGAHNVNAGKKKGLSTRRSFQCMANAYETYREAGSLPATYDVMYFYMRAN